MGNKLSRMSVRIAATSVLLAGFFLVFGVAVSHMLDRSAPSEGPTVESETDQQHELEQESSSTTGDVADAYSGVTDGDKSAASDDSDSSSAADEKSSLLLPSEVAGQVFPAVDLEMLASRLPSEKRQVFERTSDTYPDVDWTEIGPTHEAFLDQRSTFPLNLTSEQREAYAAWLREVEPMTRALIRLRAEEHGLSIGGMEGDRGYYLDGFRDGVPVYIYTANVGAAITTGASYVRWNPGFDRALGETINGSDIYMNVNDHGEIYEHTEFQLPDDGGSRVMVKEEPWYDNGNRNHMTHVAGTMAAWGYDSSLEGMAPRAWIRSLIQQRIWHITDYAMATPGQELGEDNPSTGEPQLRSVVGNTSLGFSDPYNFYNSTSANYDSTLRDYPYYMHFNSSGNSGSHGYESLTGDWKMAKNMIGIGNAGEVTRDDDGGYVSGGNIAGSSSRGPTYDGRINPDFVAKGINVRSTTNIDGSSFFSGTSMSSPNAAGSVALLMDYVRQRLPEEYLRSSTYRALLATTADDLGNPGPDYIYGWGVLNIHAAAKIVRQQADDPLQRLIIEDSLAPDATWTETYISDGTEPVRVTIAWLDPASPNHDENDRSSRLVNDLDLRIIGPDDTIHMPYVMPFTTGQGDTPAFDPSLYDAHAVQGDNTTDPVEQVFISDPVAGTYTVQVTHKDSLLEDEAQPFSVAVSGLLSQPQAMDVTRGEIDVAVGGVDGINGLTVGLENQVTYTITNVGGGELELTTPVTIDGETNCSVMVDTEPAESVVGGESTSLVLSVTPDAEGSWSFDVSIANNDNEKDPYYWTVTGVTGGGVDEVTLTAVADTYIYDQSPESNYGTEATILLNNRTQNPTASRAVLRGLLRFDLSAIPTEATVLSAALDFVQDNDNSGLVDIVEATDSWDETTATWDNSSALFGSTSFGSADTGDTAGQAVLTIMLNANGLSQVQNWVDAPADNYGFGITTTHNGNGDDNWLSLRSREHTTESDRPRLTVEYDGGGDEREEPLMVVTRDSWFLADGVTDSVAETEATVGKQLSYVVENLGTADLTLTTPITITEESNCSVTVNAEPSSSVSTNDRTDLVLTVTPLAADAWSATISITNNDPNKDPYTWTISGTALGRYHITYDANDAESGSVPTDPDSPYLEGATATVLGNTGDLMRAGFVFQGWNTSADGSGMNYASGASITMPPEDLTLYAKWNAAPEVDAGLDETIFIAESVPWTPEQINTVAWFDAKDASTLDVVDGLVRGWMDKSGNENHAEQSNTALRPPYNAEDSRFNALPTVGRSGDDYTFLETVTSLEMRHAYIVTYYDNASFPSHRVLFSQNSNDARVQGSENGTTWRTEYQFTMYRDGATSSTTDALPMDPTIWKGVADSSIDSVWRLLGGHNNWQYWDHGAAGEFILTDGEEDTQTAQQIEGYLAHKWGLALVEGHPYEEVAPGAPSAVLTLNGSASDPDEDPLTTEWSRVDGPDALVAFDDPFDPETSVAFFAAGTYTLRLTADDGFQQSYDDIVIIVEEPAETYSVTYDANDATGGDVPVDENSPYDAEASVTVLEPGSLSREGFVFADWNTAADGTGTGYEPGDTFTITTDTTLYARWVNPMVDPDTSTGALPIYPGHQEWKLVFSDEFNGTAVDTNKWNIDNSDSSRAPRTDRGINQWYWRPDNVRLEDGNLVLDVTKEDADTMHTGSINTRNIFEPTYGFFEARVEIGDTTKDTHTAFWLQGHEMGEWPPIVTGDAHNGAEVDIFESAWFGDYTKSVVHIDGYGSDQTSNTKQYSTPGLHDGFNTFGLKWTASYMKIYYNGEHKVTYDGMWVPRTNEWVWLSNGASFGDIGTFSEEEVGWLTSAKFDYVRVWEATTNLPPVFTVDLMERPLALVDEAYGDTIEGSAVDPELDPITYSKESGPDWLSVASDGSLTGTPSSADTGTNTWVVQVMDDQGGTDQATLQIVVQHPEDPRLLVGGALLNGDFNANPGDTVSFENTDAWYNTRGGQHQTATRNDETYDGTQNATVHLNRGFGVNTGHEIAEGNTFDFSYVWKDSFNWVGNSGEIKVSLFVTDDDTITGERTDLVVDYSGTRQVADTYEYVSREHVYTATAADAGKTLFAAIETDSDGFARLDNFELMVHPFGPTYSVTYDDNGSTGGTVPVDENSPYVSGETVTVLGNTGDLVKPGHTFMGWNTAADGTGTTYEPDGTFTITADTVLYAQWSLNAYTVSFVTDGTPGATLSGNTNQVVNHGGTTDVVTANTPADYLFVSWTREDIVYSYDHDVVVEDITEDQTLVANFADETVIVITAASATKVYDGTALTTNGYSITSGELEPGHTLVSVDVSGSQTDAGESANVPSNAVILDDSDDDVTDTYTITYVNGMLTVSKADSTINAWPEASDINIGEALSDSMLSGGEASVDGTFAFTNPEVVPDEGGIYVASVTFTPTEPENYTEVVGTVDVYVDDTGVLPFEEDFETLELGNLDGQNSWQASGAIVQTNVVKSGEQAAAITEGDGFVRRTFTDAQTNVWTDFYYQPVFFEEGPSTIDPEATAVIYFNLEGHPVVYNGTEPETISDVTIEAGDWVRLTIENDYTEKIWNLYLDGASVRTDLAFYNAERTHYEELTVSGAGSSSAYVDDVQILLTSPLDPVVYYTLNVFSAHGDPVPDVGEHMYEEGTWIEASVAGSPSIIEKEVKYEVNGWEGSGSGLTDGTGTNVNFSITDDTTLTWQWSTNYWIEFTIQDE